MKNNLHIVKKAPSKFEKLKAFVLIVSLVFPKSQNKNKSNKNEKIKTQLSFDVIASILKSSYYFLMKILLFDTNI